MKVLITGGAGFIGAHLAQALVAQGDEVVIFDDFNDFLYPTSLKQARLDNLFAGDQAPKVVTGSILDVTLLNQVFTDEQPELVIHLAALANPGRSFGYETAYTNTNVVGTLHVLQAATASKVKYFIMAGSSSVYNDQQTPFKEDAYPLRPRSVYGASKAAAETYCALWHDLTGLPMTITRFFSVYGPWGRPDMAPMIFAEKILTGQPLAVTREVRARDFTYIDDVVAGILKVTAVQPSFEIINLGRGEPTKLPDLIVALEKAAGATATITEREAPPGEMEITYADTTKAKQLLGYEPKISVTEGTEKLVTWMKEWYLPNKRKNTLVQ